MIYRYEFPNSAMLANCEYNSVDCELTVTFQNGKSYVYIDVDKRIYDELINANSAGKYFNLCKKQLKVKVA